MDNAEIILAYYAGKPVDELARQAGRPWQEVANLVGHVWLRPKHIDERGYPIAEDETWQASSTVVGL